MPVSNSIHQIFSLSCVFSCCWRWITFQTFLLESPVHLGSRPKLRVVSMGTASCVCPQLGRRSLRYQKDKVWAQISCVKTKKLCTNGKRTQPENTDLGGLPMWVEKLKISIFQTQKNAFFSDWPPCIFCLSNEFDKYEGAVEFSLSIYSNPLIEVSDWRFSHDNSNMPLQRSRHQVALYRSVIKVLTFFFLILTSSFRSLLSFFHPSFLSLSLTSLHTVLSLSSTLTYFSIPLLSP